MKKRFVITIEEFDDETKEAEQAVVETNSFSTYARFFDEGCSPWTNNAEYNLRFLKLQEQYANDILKTKGYIFLNDVYDMLGMPRSRAGALIGWVYDENNTTGDNFVDFGIHNLKNKDFVNGRERSVLLDFNVDGMILDKLP